MVKKLYAVFFGLMTWAVSYAQPNLTLYNFQNVAQSTMLNPGIRPQAGFTLGFPAIYTGLQIPGITTYDILGKNIPADSVLPFILKNPSKNFKDIQIDLQTDVFYLGFAVKRNYFNIGMQINAN